MHTHTWLKLVALLSRKLNEFSHRYYSVVLKCSLETNELQAELHLVDHFMPRRSWRDPSGRRLRPTGRWSCTRVPSPGMPARRRSGEPPSSSSAPPLPCCCRWPSPEQTRACFCCCCYLSGMELVAADEQRWVSAAASSRWWRPSSASWLRPWPLPALAWRRRISSRFPLDQRRPGSLDFPLATTPTPINFNVQYESDKRHQQLLNLFAVKINWMNDKWMEDSWFSRLCTFSTALTRRRIIPCFW